MSSEMPIEDVAHVTDEVRDLYGREYWFSHQVDHLQQPDIEARARGDLPERCLTWLRSVLKYRVPPGKTLEIGCGHGAFVALLRWAGFDARGTELSPWVVNFSKDAFGVPVFATALEDLDIDPAAEDVVVLIDVLEHLRDPRDGLQKCASALERNGIVVIQTPSYPDELSYADLRRTDDRFLEMLLPQEHLFLLSRRALTTLLAEVGLSYYAFEAPVFPYDMFVIASAQPLRIYDSPSVDNELERTASGRMVLALLDADARLQDSMRRIAQSEDDRVARLAVIETQGETLGRIEADRNNLAAELRSLRAQFAKAEADRAARLKVIENQGDQLGRALAERNVLRHQLDDLQTHFESAEADRAARLKIIERLEADVRGLLAERDALRSQLEVLKDGLNLATEPRSRRKGRL